MTWDPKRVYQHPDDYEARIKELEHEIEILRLYGNKDCTAMADERLAQDRAAGHKKT